VLRWTLIVATTAYLTLTLWRWHRIVAILALIPVCVIVVNVFGFLTVPLYWLTPEETGSVREILEREILNPKPPK